MGIADVHESLKICGRDFEIVKLKEYKYKGSIIDDQLCMNPTSEAPYKKLLALRLYFRRMLITKY